MIRLEDYIRNIPDFPKPGIQFKDITPLLASPEAFNQAIDQMAEPFMNKGITKVVGIEARGFLFATPLAIKLNAGMIPIRKPGKLPYKSTSFTYELEYGSDTIEMHEDAVAKGEKVLVVDDLLATGGTINAARNLLEQQSAQIQAFCFVIELEFLKGREKIGDYPVYSLLTF